MKVFEDLKRKESIDAERNKNGQISDVKWNQGNNMIQSIVTQGEPKMGLEKRITISYGDINSIGDKKL